MKSRDNNVWVLILLLLSGIVLGGLIGEMASNIPALSFLDYGKSFGFGAQAPLILDLSVMKITFGVSFHLTVSVILGILLSILVYKRIG